MGFYLGLLVQDYFLAVYLSINLMVTAPIQEKVLKAIL